MMYKIALIAALCVAQGLAHKPHFKSHVKPPAFFEDENIAEDLEEAAHEMEEVAEDVSIAAMDAYFNGRDPDVVVECFRQEKDSYEALGQRMHKKIEDAHKEMSELLGDKFEPYAKKFAVPVKAIEDAAKAYPVILWSHIKEKDFAKAAQATREFRRIVAINSRIMERIKGEMVRQYPQVAKRAGEIWGDIRREAGVGCGAIRENIRKCIQAGGPNKA